MDTTLSCNHVGPGRSHSAASRYAQDLVTRGRRAGAADYLGVELGGCRGCVARAIDARLRALETAPELEYLMRGLPDATVAWHRRALTREEARAAYGDGRTDIIYIPVSKHGVPRKVGISGRPLTERYSAAAVTAMGANKFWVGQVTQAGRPVSRSTLEDVERLAARRLHHGGARLPHDRSKKNQTLVIARDAIAVRDVLPQRLASRYPLAAGGAQRDVKIARGGRYELQQELAVDRSGTRYVQWLQRSLNAILHLALSVDGIAGTATREAVRSFQRLRGLLVDGVVGPQTEQALIIAGAGLPPAASGPATAPSEPPQPSAAGTTLSGASWVNQFPTSRTLDSLIEPFRGNVGRFIAALRSAGASVSIAATYRPVERAFLMRYAWEISKNGMDPAAVPAQPGIAIRWVHTDRNGNVDRAASKAAADAMVAAYAIAYRPSLTSKHTARTAIDMTIGWANTLNILDGAGRRVTISSTPRDGAGNTQLHAVARSYKVIKLASDPPHWSDTGG